MEVNVEGWGGLISESKSPLQFEGSTRDLAKVKIPDSGS